jgi:hypothetical protein
MFFHTGSLVSPFLHYSMLPVTHGIESHDSSHDQDSASLS